MKRGRWRGRPPPWAEFAAASRLCVRAVTQDCSARSSDRRGSAGSVVPAPGSAHRRRSLPHTATRGGRRGATPPRCRLPSDARPSTGVRGPTELRDPGKPPWGRNGPRGLQRLLRPLPSLSRLRWPRPCHCRKRVAGGKTCHWVDPAAEGRSADEEPNPAPRKRDASAEQCGRPGPQHWGAAPLPLTVLPPCPAGTASRSCPQGRPFVET